MRKFITFMLFFAVAFGDVRFEILVEQMHCPLCTAMVRKAVLKVDGVKSAKASLQGKKAVVIADDSVVESDLIKAILTTGYEAKIVKNSKE